jgi:hypothetical protein
VIVSPAVAGVVLNTLDLTAEDSFSRLIPMSVWRYVYIPCGSPLGYIQLPTGSVPGKMRGC